ncbi:DNA repair protein RecN [Massilioclostridium coli]|uniref:DNA repair protein RecN n=1 Tax=Massilioclostridium coli TaxID=1870991 RepID=UPI0022E1B070|nr:DNA repair protein RecN [Massilioclostridium coli]
MLTGLFIQNLAVIEKVYMEFGKGFHVFTGETGAGKSIVIDAINGILGGRCSKELVRSGTEKAVMIGSFQDVPQQVVDILRDNGVDLEDELVIQREISVDGKSVARICGRPVTVGLLKEIGSHLINIHGQHDNQILLSPERHMEILDCFGEINTLLSEYQRKFHRFTKVEKELEEINEKQQTKNQKLDLLHYQIDEIEQADLELGEDVELEHEARAIRNYARITESLHEAYQALDGEDELPGASSKLVDAVNALEYASEYYNGVDELKERLKGIAYEVEDIRHEVASKLEEFDMTPNRLDAIEARLDEIFKLKRKYGATIQEVLDYQQNCQKQLEQIEGYDIRQNELMVEQKQLRLACGELAEQLTEQRRKAAKQLVNTVAHELKFLDMANVTLQVHWEKTPFQSKGRDKIEFLISTNVGEPPKPIAKIASGGELSRIMLAIKNALADKDQIPTLIFDEVDTGVSGSAAQKIGLKLKQVSKNRQVFSVTHLAQIAALADIHFRIRKSVKGNRTYTEVLPLDEHGRVQEVARIMSTGEITDLMMKNAQEMIQRGRQSAES